MSEIRATVILHLNENMLDDFIRYCSDIVQKVSEKETGNTITYQFYMSANDPKICFAHEVYKDAESLSKHINNMSNEDSYHHIFSIKKIDICGYLPDDMVRSMQDFAESENIQFDYYPKMCATI